MTLLNPKFKFMVLVGGKLLAGRVGYWQKFWQLLVAYGSLLRLSSSTFGLLIHKSEASPDVLLHVLLTFRFRTYVKIYTL
jgi:hypothetical protein